VRIISPADLSRALTDLLANQAERLALGRRAHETLRSQRGATQFTMDHLRSLLKRDASEAHSA
jgi:hypothetical protein